MSTTTPVGVSREDFIQLDPHKELKEHSCWGKVWKVAAYVALVAFGILAVAATIAVGFYVPLYVPIVITAAVIMADCVFNHVFTPLLDKGKAHTAQAKINQGIVDELDKLADKNDLLQARVNYFTNYAENKCVAKIAKHMKDAQKDETGTSLMKAGKWVDKKLTNKTCAAYSAALQVNKTIEAPTFSNNSFEMRPYFKRFLKTTDFLKLSSGVILSAKQVETMSISELTEKMLEGKKPAPRASSSKAATPAPKSTPTTTISTQDMDDLFGNDANGTGLFD